MTEEMRIADMIREMESTFRERESLFKERDEAFQQRYHTFIKLENKLKEQKNSCQVFRQELQLKEEELQRREKELLDWEERLKQDQDVFQKEYEEKQRKLEGEQFRLGMLESNVKNEKVRQQIAQMRYESQLLSEGRMLDQETVLSTYLPADGGLETPVLQVENDKLMNTISELTRKNEEYEKELSRLEKEKRDLFRKLLETDGLLELSDYDSKASAEMEEEKADEHDLQETEAEIKAPAEKIPDVGESDYMDRLYDGFDKDGHDPVAEIREGRKQVIKIPKDKYLVKIVRGAPPFFEIHYPMKESRKILKTIQNMYDENGTVFSYDRDKKEVVITSFFEEHSEPDDVENDIRCLIDYEIPLIVGKGG